MQQLDNHTDAELVAMPRPNIKLLDEVLDYIIEHDDEWNQSWFTSVTAESSCGTTMCFAGHTCALAGDLIIRDDLELILTRPDGKRWFAAAMEHLGLTLDEADRMFYGTITVEDGETITDEEYRAGQLKNVKVEVERIRARAKAQDAAFNRLAQEFIDAAGLDDVVKPGYLCPESEEVMQGIKGGASE